MTDTCPTCGSPVEVVSSDEGTSHYQPRSSNRYCKITVERDGNTWEWSCTADGHAWASGTAPSRAQATDTALHYAGQHLAEPPSKLEAFLAGASAPIEGEPE